MRCDPRILNRRSGCDKMVKTILNMHGKSYSIVNGSSGILFHTCFVVNQWFKSDNGYCILEFKNRRIPFILQYGKTHINSIKAVLLR